MVSPGYSVGDHRFVSTISGISGETLSDGNRVTLLKDAKETFDALIEMLHSAKKTINIEIYIFEEGEIGRIIGDLLIQKAAEGVRINLLVDSIGSWGFLNSRIGNRMEKAGIRTHYYNRFFSTSLFSYNRRTHKKLVIVDGRRGMLGGFGISDKWYSDPHPLKDLQVDVEGPVVLQMQRSFQKNWKEITGETFSDADYFPQPKTVGAVKARLINSSPYRGKGTLHQMFQFVLKSAKRYVWIETAYFIPDPFLRNGLKEAARRGVDVRLLVPALDSTDVKMTVFSSRNYYEELLEAGVKLYEYDGPMRLHSKWIIMDDAWATIGSANFDNRSLKITDEANLNLYDPTTVTELKRLFLDDQRDSKRLTLAKFNGRSLWNWFPEKFFYLFDSQF